MASGPKMKVLEICQYRSVPASDLRRRLLGQPTLWSKQYKNTAGYVWILVSGPAALKNDSCGFKKWFLWVKLFSHVACFNALYKPVTHF